MSGPSKRKFLVLGALAVVLSTVVGFGYYYLYGPCGRVSVEQSVDLIDNTFNQFGQIASNANVSAGDALANHVSEMNRVRAEFDGESMPVCLSRARDEYSAAMFGIVDAYYRVLKGESIAGVSTAFSSAGDKLTSARDEIERIEVCAPFC